MGWKKQQGRSKRTPLRSSFYMIQCLFLSGVGLQGSVARKVLTVIVITGRSAAAWSVGPEVVRERERCTGGREGHHQRCSCGMLQGLAANDTFQFHSLLTS